MSRPFSSKLNSLLLFKLNGVCASLAMLAFVLALSQRATFAGAGDAYHLVFGIGMHDEGQFTPVGGSDGMSFAVHVDDGGAERKTLFEIFKSKTDRQIDYVAVDLSEFAGKAVRVRFTVGPGPDGNAAYDWGVWIDPRIVRGELPSDWMKDESSLDVVFRAIDRADHAVKGVGEAEGLERGAIFDPAAVPMGWDVNATPWAVKICYGQKVRGILAEPAWDGEPAPSWAEYTIGLGVDAEPAKPATSDKEDDVAAEGDLARHAKLSEAATLATQLERLIADGKSRGLQMRLPRVTAGVLKIFIPRIGEDLDGIVRFTGPNFPGWGDHGPPYGFANVPVEMRSKRELSKKFIDDRRKRGEQMAAYLVDAARRAIDEAQQILDDPGKDVRFPDYDMGKLAIRDGYFYSGDTPALLTGLYTNRDVTGDYAALSEIGICFTQPERLNVHSVLPAENEVRPEFVDAFVVRDTLEPAQQHNIGCFFDLGLQYLPGWATEKPDLLNPGSENNHYGPYSIVSSAMRDLTARYLQVLVPRASKYPVTVGYEMANQLYLNPWSPQVIEMFRQWARQEYETIDKANRRWRSSFASFDDVSPDLNMRKIEPRGLRYDWLRFQQRLGAEWFTWLKGEIHKHDSQARVAIQPAGNLFEPQKFALHDTVRVGINEVDVYRNITDVTGIDFCTWYWGRFVYEQAGQHCDLLRSIAPDKPVINFEYGLGTYNSIRSWTPQYMRASLWYCYLHGMAGNTAWIWTVTELADETQTNSFARWPDRVEAYGRAALELRRHAEQVVAFGRQKGQVAILYSAPSRWFDELKETDYFEQARRLWHATSMLDAPFEFISDEQIAQGDLERFKVLLVPTSAFATDATFDGIKQWVRDGGGTIMLLDGSFSRDAYDAPRKLESVWSKAHEVNALLGGKPPARFGGGHVYAVRPAAVNEYQKLIDRILDRADVARPVRVSLPNGAVNRSIELRSATDASGQQWLYCFNLDAAAVSFELRLKPGYQLDGPDVLGGRAPARKMSLKPMELALWKLSAKPPQP